MDKNTIAGTGTRTAPENGPAQAADQKGTAGEDAAGHEARIRAIAMQHALSIEEKKKLQNKVLDMIIVAYDLPSHETTDPAHPSSADAATFRECLAIFRPSDLDELVDERNIDDRCGYAMCKNPNQKRRAAKVWDNAQGKMVDKATDGKWCSSACKARNAFVRSQLSLEPAWLRAHASDHIQLPSDVTATHHEVAAPMAGAQGKEQTQHHAREILALERGEPNANLVEDIPIREKEVTKPPTAPTYVPEITVSDVLEGLPVQSIGRGRSIES